MVSDRCVSSRASASAVPVASVLTLFSAVGHVVAGGETPTLIGVLLALAVTHAVWRIGLRRLAANSRRFGRLACLGLVFTLQAVVHVLFSVGAGSGEPLVVSGHHGAHAVHHASGAHGAHAAHGIDLAMVAAHAAVAAVMIALLASFDLLVERLLVAVADLRRLWMAIVERPLVAWRFSTAFVHQDVDQLASHAGIGSLWARGPPAF